MAAQYLREGAGMFLVILLFCVSMAGYAIGALLVLVALHFWAKSRRLDVWRWYLPSVVLAFVGAALLHSTCISIATNVNGANKIIQDPSLDIVIVCVIITVLVCAYQLKIKVPGALFGYICMGDLLWLADASLWYLAPIILALVLLVYATYLSRNPLLLQMDGMFQGRADGFYLFSSALNPLHLAPVWHTPLAYGIVLTTIPYAIGIPVLRSSIKNKA